MRAVTDLAAMGERTLIVDCDVIQADGGTRTAAITGAYVALHRAMETLTTMGVIARVPMKSAVAATSVGIVRGEALLDLTYEEDSQAEVDFNVVMTDRGDLVEVQGTAEGRPFAQETVGRLLDLGRQGISELFSAQREALARATGG